MNINSDDLRIFIAVVDCGTLSAAAEQLGQTTSGLSRALSRLEQKLATSLLTRTTRRMELTEEGHLFLEKARAIVTAMEEAEEAIQVRHQRPSGRLRVDASPPFMLHCVVPHIAEFRSNYPDITLELTSNDQNIDLLEQRTDIAIRHGALQDSMLHARRLGASALHIVASPGYLRQHGTPADADELKQHQLLGFTQPESLNIWPLRHQQDEQLGINPTLLASGGETIRQLALHGLGIACLSAFMVREDIARGTLIDILAPYNNGYRQQIHAVYYRNTQLARRISCFLDFLQLKL
ncbi:LysR family transcriptional regulator [Collimonas pratensis]|uniref:Bacterial regulatory helix-turn-helix, lysR family protein n=1 Tax=Collimonas pratensis TaxID=279113 RepID=A0A127Q8B3_9BURK|nr:LysR family transcriptional regulator [Collimonas pratensis]AMP06283.1 bacterial regulatory helix-turn-helix, lysR family protein [Collimonas pratensis]NKI70543.1 LysR family transcriptional regulator [Collimonas pratensis]